MLKPVYIVAFLLSLTWAISAGATSIRPPHTCAIESPDEKHLLVIRLDGVPGAGAPAALAELGPIEREKVARLRATYSQSGLYPREGGRTPLWIAPDVGPFDALTLADNDHMIRRQAGAESPNDDAISFYERGVHMCSYRVKDLLDDPRVLNRGSKEGLPPRWCDRSVVDLSKRTFVVETVEGRRIVFDAATGKVLSREMIAAARWDAYLVAAVAGGITVTLGGALLLWRLRKARLGRTVPAG